jgi:hypothetical protein
MSPMRAKLFIIITKVNDLWGTPDYVMWPPDRLTRAFEICQEENGPDSFRAFDVIENKGVKF